MPFDDLSNTWAALTTPTANPANAEGLDLRIVVPGRSMNSPGDFAAVWIDDAFAAVEAAEERGGAVVVIGIKADVSDSGDVSNAEATVERVWAFDDLAADPDLLSEVYGDRRSEP